jgi:DNA-binding response OmpR family regulator
VTIITVQGGLVIDDHRRIVTLDGRVVTLSRLPFDFLALLATDPERAWRREELLKEVWGYQSTSGVSFGALNVCASTVRKALDGRYVFNVRGIGYRLVDVESALEAA